jgi:Zn-dependent membrane protease YugP
MTEENMFFFDPLYFVFLAPALILSLFAQWRVKSTYQKYSQVPNQQRIPGARAARQLLDNAGLSGVQIEHVPGDLTDHYDPTSKTLRLSDGVINNASVAALGIVAHECGHAVQDAKGYTPMRVRGAIVPAVNIGSGLGPLLIMVGIGLTWFVGVTNFSVWLIWGGVILFALAALFALITLPVELDASSRAMQLLTNAGLVDRTEYSQARSVLNAAALTYVAGLAAAILQLLYYVMLASGVSGRNRN